MKYQRVNGFHYILKGKDWYVMIANKWYKCSPPRADIKLPLLINDNVLEEKDKASNKGEQ